jgi:hypothetical protein
MCEGVKNITNITSSLLAIPNPNAGSFTLTLSSPNNEPAQITITNTLGRKVKEFTTTTNKETDVQLDVAPGVYFISGVANSGNVSGKIVVE